MLLKRSAGARNPASLRENASSRLQLDKRAKEIVGCLMDVRSEPER